MAKTFLIDFCSAIKFIFFSLFFLLQQNTLIEGEGSGQANIVKNVYRIVQHPFDSLGPKIQFELQKLIFVCAAA